MQFAHLHDRLRFFIHPLPLSAVILMAMNDHWLKYNYTSYFTGKLSDFCGVFYLPIFLLALIAAFNEIFDLKIFRLNGYWVVGSIAFTDFLMLVVKLSPNCAKAIENFFQHYLFSIQLVADPTDLISFVMNPLTFFYLRTYWMRSKET